MTSLADYEEAFKEPQQPRTAEDLSNAVGYDITADERSQLTNLADSGDSLAESALEMQEKFDRGCFDNLATMVH